MKLQGFFLSVILHPSFIHPIMSVIDTEGGPELVPKDFLPPQWQHAACSSNKGSRLHPRCDTSAYINFGTDVFAHALKPSKLFPWQCYLVHTSSMGSLQENFRNKNVFFRCILNRSQCFDFTVILKAIIAVKRGRSHWVILNPAVTIYCRWLEISTSPNVYH